MPCRKMACGRPWIPRQRVRRTSRRRSPPLMRPSRLDHLEAFATMNPIQLFDPLSSTYPYLLFDVSSRDALIIDPVDEQIERDLTVLREYGLKLAWTVETHAHADHITSAGQLAEHAGARTAAPEGCGITTAAVQLKDGDSLSFGAERIKALHTP